MDIARPVQSSPLQFECPHCALVEDDEYELLDSDLPIDVRCSGCDRSYTVAVMECDACGAECLFSWMLHPAAEVFAQLGCVACGRRYRDHETFPASTAHPL